MSDAISQLRLSKLRLSLSLGSTLRILPLLLERKLLHSSLRLGIVLQGSAPLLHRRVGRQVDVAEVSDSDPRPESEIGNGGAVKRDEARTTLFLPLELVLENLVKTCGLAFESSVGRLLGCFAVGLGPVVVDVVDVSLRTGSNQKEKKGKRKRKMRKRRRQYFFLRRDINLHDSMMRDCQRYRQHHHHTIISLL